MNYTALYVPLKGLTISVPAVDDGPSMEDAPLVEVLDGFAVDERTEILVAELSDYPFETFSTNEEDDVLECYIQTEFLTDESRAEILALVARFGVDAHFEQIQTRNWNEEWERNFEPVAVEDRLLIRAPFHAAPRDGVMDVVLTPHMSFGTGHHSTTWMMSHATLSLDVRQRVGLDIGSGTGVLAIVAAKCGARHVDAVDIDDVCLESCRENVLQNGVEKVVTPILGVISAVEGHHYDFILANINRNILLGQMDEMAQMLNAGGDLLMSGFLEEDVEMLVHAAQLRGLHLQEVSSRDEWRMIHMKR